MSCCNNNNSNNNNEDGRDYPEGIEPCCSVRGRRCFCLPYDDPLMMTSQILSIVAVFFSWAWWLTFIISIVGMVLIQIPWCCRQRGGFLYGSAAAAGVTALCSLGAGVYVLVAFRLPKKNSCEPWSLSAMYDDDDDWFDDDLYTSKDSDNCREEVWGTIALVCTALWAAAFGCLVHFVKSGRHAKWEKQHSGCDNNGVMELEAVGGASADPVVTDAAVVSEPVGKVDDGKV
jgi:hypothetical protein